MGDPASYQSLGWLMLALFSLAGGANQVMRLLDRLKEKPNPAETYLTKTEAARMETRLETQLVERVRVIEAQHNSDLRELRDEIHGMRAQFVADLTRVHARLDDLLESTQAVTDRVIATLRNTGAIGPRT